MKYYPKIVGERVYLSPICLDDAELYTEWLNDLSTTRFLMLSSKQVTLQGEREVLARISGDHNYAIVERATNALLGNCGFMEADETSRSAEVGIFIGPGTKRGIGYGTVALRLLCDYGFNALNFRSIMLRVYAYNDRGVASYRKIGFKEIGLRRKAHFYGGEYHDIVYMDLLPEDFGSSRLPPIRDSQADPSA